MAAQVKFNKQRAKLGKTTNIESKQAFSNMIEVSRFEESKYIGKRNLDIDPDFDEIRRRM